MSGRRGTILEWAGDDTIGAAPAVLCWNPKTPANIGMIVRLASCFGVRQVWWTGERMARALDSGRRLPGTGTGVRQKRRLPREERMKLYDDVALVQSERPFDRFPREVEPVAVEVRPCVQLLHSFAHPANPLYVFGPEDGSLPGVALRHCHHHVVIPSRHCLNLATAVAVVLYDREAKLIESGSGSGFATPGQWELRGGVR